jgi:hypothetical protein
VNTSPIMTISFYSCLVHVARTDYNFYHVNIFRLFKCSEDNSLS